IADILIAKLASAAPTPESKITIKREVNELLDKLRRCKSIKLTIAFQPDDATIALYSDWIKKNVNPDILLDLQFDRSIVGGAQIISGGKYKDYSVKKNLINRFQIQRDEILKLLE
ncbi:MAG TPA: F0F1 ATP synthase subunit delta, partial [Candidatus Saccharimonadales bacterium]|nr:F0F1 ATP synthase subunit delta [Candidatus Saccharimonadales bacterium]